MSVISRTIYARNGGALAVDDSPLVSDWIDVSGYASVMPFFEFAGGTSAHSIEGSWDGVTADADFDYGTLASGTAVDVISPYIRWSTVQTVADATKSKVYLAARP